MLLSMTGFARAQEPVLSGLLICELRSLNHRYLEISLKLPEGYKEWESDCRDCIQKNLSRGKIECVLQFVPNGDYAPTLNLHQGLVNALIQATTQIKEASGLKDAAQLSGWSVADLLRWPGVLVQSHLPTEQLKKPILTVITNALQKLISVRQQEGQKLSHFLEEKRQICVEKLDQITTLLPQTLNLKKQKLIEKLSLLTQEIDQNRVEQELVYFAQRLDVAEEIERFDTHLKELERILAIAEPICEGRRLDFLMQEMQREINTLNNKSLNSEISRLAVDLKVIVEQMREQIQNIE